MIVEATYGLFNIFHQNAGYNVRYLYLNPRNQVVDRSANPNNLFKDEV